MKFKNKKKSYHTNNWYVYYAICYYESLKNTKSKTFNVNWVTVGNNLISSKILIHSLIE